MRTPLGLLSCSLLACASPAPHAVDDTASVLEDQSVLIDVRANDRNVDRVRIATIATSHGEIRIVGAGIEYTPAPDFYGTDSFSYTGLSSDPERDDATTTVAHVTVTVTPDRKPPLTQELAVSNWPLTIATGDFDRDELIDLVTYQQDGSVVIFLQRRATGELPTFEPFIAHAAEEEVKIRPHDRRRSLLVADLDRDGRPDLAWVRHRDIVLLYNRSDEGLGFEEATLSPDDLWLDDSQTLVVGDLNCDGRSDLVTGTRGYVSGDSGPITGRIRVFPSLTYDGAALSHEPSLALDRPLSRNTELRLVPHGDDCADLLFTVEEALQQLRWHGDGTLTAATLARTPYYFDDLAAVDLDSDGRTEVLITPSLDPVLMFSESALESPSVLETQGELIAVGRFDAEDQAQQVAITDYCQLRIFAASREAPLTLEPRGDFRIFEPTSCPFTSGAAVADLDGDGRDDLIVAHGDYVDSERRETAVEEGLIVIWSREVE
jgi:Bacterial Ig domain/FG-GAP-like repeat